MTSMRRNDVASTSFRRHVPTKFLINQCQIITFLILKSDNIEKSRKELKGIVLQVPSNQIKVTFIIILEESIARRLAIAQSREKCYCQTSGNSTKSGKMLLPDVWQ